MTSFSALISIIGVCLSLVANAISFPLLVMLFIERRHKLAPLFLINVCTWLIGGIFCSVYFLYIALFWKGDYSLYSMTWMFWLGTPFFGVMASLSTSIFFLTWDRCLTLIMTTSYNKKRRDIFIQICIHCQVLSIIWMTYWLNTDRPPLGKINDCMSYGCVSPTLSPKVTYMKLFFAATNMISALIFGLLFVKFSRKEPASCPINSRKSNMIAFLTLFTEIFFNCLPNCLAEIIHMSYGVVLSPIIGPYVSYLFSLECFIMTLLYANTMGLICKRQKISNTMISSQITPIKRLNSGRLTSQKTLVEVG